MFPPPAVYSTVHIPSLYPLMGPTFPHKTVLSSPMSWRTSPKVFGPSMATVPISDTSVEPYVPLDPEALAVPVVETNTDPDIPP